MVLGAKVCPCEPRYGADPSVWKDLPCPAENLQSFRHFTQLIRDLEVKAENHVDVMQVIEIVKLMIYEARCDQDLQDEGRMFDLQVGQLNQQSGVAYWNKVTPVALATQGQLAARRMKIYKDLVASRDARAEAHRKEMKAAAALGNVATGQNIVKIMTRLNERNIQLRRTTQIEDAGRVSRTEIDDADVEIDEPDGLVPEVSEDLEDLTDIGE